jgi:hypothetical protein
MVESDRTNDEASDDSLNETGGGTTGMGNADSITPQAEVSGGDPASVEGGGGGRAGGEQAIGDEERGTDSPVNARGVGDWDPASAGGGGGELY